MVDNSYKRLSINTILVFIGKAGSSLVALLMLPFYTKWLTTSEYGSVDLINTYATIMLSIASCSIASAIFVIPNKSNKTECTSYYTTGLIFICLVSFILILLCCVLQCFLFDESFLESNSWYIAGLTISMIFQNYTQQFTRTINKMLTFSTVGIIQAISTAGLALLIIPDHGLSGYIISLIVSNVLSSIYALFASGSYHYIQLNSLSINKLTSLLKYSIPLMPNTIMWWLVNGFNRPLMESELGLSAIGLYAVAMKFPNIINSINDVFMNAFSISMLEEYGKPSFHVFFNNIFKGVFFTITILAICITLFAKQIITIFATTDYYSAWIILPVLTLSSVFSCASSLMGGVFIARKQSKYYLYSSIYGAITSVCLTIVLIKMYGLIGCATASAISFLIMFYVRFFYAKRDIPGFDNKWFMVMCLLLILVVSVKIYMDQLHIQPLLLLTVIAFILLYNRTLLNIIYMHLKQFIYKL